jgi:sporulation protein YlmC with PRC-barrel domain
MKIMVSAVFAILLALTTAQAQQSRRDVAAGTSPITGLDNEAWGKSARASKLIGSKVYKGDTSIGQIEDVLVDLDHATVTAMILSVGGFLGIGDKLVAVPVNQIKVGSEAKFTTDLTKDQPPTLLLLILPSRNKRPQGARVSLFSGEIPCKLFD